jgi:hypothetical protein
MKRSAVWDKIISEKAVLLTFSYPGAYSETILLRFWSISNQMSPLRGNSSQTTIAGTIFRNSCLVHWINESTIEYSERMITKWVKEVKENKLNFSNS